MVRWCAMLSSKVVLSKYIILLSCCPLLITFLFHRPIPITLNYVPNMRRPIYILSTVSGVALDDVKKCLLNPEHHDKYILEMHRIMVNTAVAYGKGLCGIDCEPDSDNLTPPIRTLLASISKLEY